jgi:hypothetical protein
VAIQLRYLQTVTEIAAENNSTTLFPIPMEMFRPFMEWGQRGSGAARQQSGEVSSATQAFPLPQITPALPPAEMPMAARELTELMQRMRATSATEGEGPRKKD